jgi:hypothetical protein
LTTVTLASESPSIKYEVAALGRRFFGAQCQGLGGILHLDNSPVAATLEPRAQKINTSRQAGSVGRILGVRLIRGRRAKIQAALRRGMVERQALEACQGEIIVQHRVMQVRMKKSPSAKTGLNLFA